MNKKKILSLSLVALLTTSVLVGCNTVGTVDFKSEEVFTEFKNEVYRYSLGAQEKYTSKDFAKNLNSFLRKLDDNEKEKYLTYYVQGLYNNASDLTDKMGVLGYELEDIIAKYEITNYTYDSFKLLPDEYGTVKGYIQEVEDKGFLITRSASTDLLTVTVDLDTIIQDYGVYMKDSLKNYYEFNDYENRNEFIKDNNIDIEEVVNRIIEIEKGINTDKNSGYEHIDKWITSYTYYYDILFGNGHELFLSSGYFKDDVVKKYEELAEKHKDKEVGKNLANMVETLKANNNKVTTDISNKSNEFVENKLKENDSEIQKAIDELGANMEIEDVAEKLGVSVEELLGTESGAETQSTDGATTETETTTEQAESSN